MAAFFGVEESCTVPFDPARYECLRSFIDQFPYMASHVFTTDEVVEGLNALANGQ